MKQVEVKILQQSYLLACKEGQETRLTEAVTLVDGAMTRIHDAGKVRARERIAVLAALNLAFELGDLRQAHQQLLAQLPEPTPEGAAEDPPTDDALNREAAIAYKAQNLALQTLIGKLQTAMQEPSHLAANAPTTPVQVDVFAEAEAEVTEQPETMLLAQASESEQEQPTGL